MRGGTYKRRRKGECNQIPKDKTTSPSAPFPITESTDDLACTNSGHKPLQSTPRRCIRKFHQIQEQCALSPIEAQSPELICRLSSPSSEKEQQTELPGSRSKPCNRVRSHKPRQIIKKQKACIKSDGIHTKSRGRRKRKTDDAILTHQSSTEEPQHCRSRLNLEKTSDVEQDESLPSSDLSIELSVHEEPLPHLSFQEDEENDQEEEEEDLPSYLMVDTKSSSITKGGFVWYKFRNFPFWPAVVKSVNHKLKRASVMFVDEKLIRQKRGFLVALKTLKPYECEEFNDLICKAKENYDVAIQWSVDLIEDYIMRKGIGSFSGSFIEYYAHNISYPVRRKYQANSERLTIANDVVMEESLPVNDLPDDSFSEQLKESRKSSKRILPDRTHAAHNRANEKLVYFIVKQRMVEQHLLAVMRGHEPSRWLRSFLSVRRRRVVNIYLEDDEQLDQVYWYLSNLYTTALETDACHVNVKSIDHVPFVLDVLLPEAIIHAIAGVDNISIIKAEEKYLKGRCISNRERQEFDLMIEQQMKTKSFSSALAPFSDSVK